jgi:hypothetical protein
LKPSYAHHRTNHSLIHSRRVSTFYCSHDEKRAFLLSANREMTNIPFGLLAAPTD